ncbi:helix-turn-helix transcriptional regulator [Gorillibacterium sp. sgz5001074]|uniref:helix-turn-helix transcriptional regulator n=1 Tax=Gorillibacterium sp. sgz5001074 TaxID=3446695 RepID=UPI003F666829
MSVQRNRLAELRVELGLTQEEVAKKLELSRAALSHYETNRREPDFQTIRKCADYYGVTIDYILGRTNDRDQTLDEAVGEWVDALELSDEALLDKFSLTVDGRKLSPEEARRFIAFIRAERSMR